jgi:uncharacterized membrane protein YgcG
VGELLMAKFDLKGTWPEVFGFFLLLIGFSLGIFATSAVMSYLIIFFSGAIFGRLWYRAKKNFQFSFFIVILGFLVGYLLGSSLLRYGSKGVMVIFFVLGWIATYYLHVRGIISSRDL